MWTRPARAMLAGAGALVLALAGCATDAAPTGRAAPAAQTHTPAGPRRPPPP
ncbi:hypothetical protein [Embleya sp. NBC_00896]|uniref:hypothetical protein n=1 Tax=Embleya sp. NBC_00896 TaxID=2975961 RepID=UPI0038688D5B|nr:hypothetical protein OG928_21720 [Embleya sp. NBC_00896]